MVIIHRIMKPVVIVLSRRRRMREREGWGEPS
jgi:hypothetical protein